MCIFRNVGLAKKLMAWIIALVLGSSSLASANSADLLWLLERRVRIQSATLEPGWHEGLFNRQRKEPPCYVVVIFKSRPSSDTPMQLATIVPLQTVSRLEAYAGPASRMSEWVGRQPAALTDDSLWQPVAHDMVDDDKDCFVVPGAGPLPFNDASSNALEASWSAVRVSLVQDERVVTRDIDAQLQLRLIPAAHAGIDHFGWTVSVTERATGSESHNLVYHSRYFHGPYPTDVLAWNTHSKLFPDERVLPVYGYPWEIRIRLLAPVAEAAGDTYRFVSGELEVAWRRLPHINPVPE